ncbi:hypothetical protein E4U60_002794 [Claviceps pazoutovae]|uniref:Extracellular membrane protein CFEM domain-containing protein n=1 Tax=Claviceps pazoutovae TaxID=1649127 RepID=A0A9P7MIG6_9HYPO|nr:hypothetical protein E4U60_002794 [Claviceps pazoutovae]
MRVAFLGTILFSITARSQSDAASTQAVCVDDCIKSLAEHGLLTNGMKSICAAPQLQKAHFQCLINACSTDSYGSAVKQSISVCSANGANIIPLHPIEVRQPQSSKHGQSQMGGQASEHLSMVKNQKLHLPRNVAMDLTCNTGGDGLVTVSLGPPLPSATPSIFEKEDVRKQSPRATPISSHEGIMFVKDAKALMEEFQDANSRIRDKHDVYTKCYEFHASVFLFFINQSSKKHEHEHEQEQEHKLSLGHHLKCRMFFIFELLE